MDCMVCKTVAIPGVCYVRLCRHRITPKTALKNGRFCRRCRDRRYKLRHPVAYALNKLRSNARRRGHECSLTLAEFEVWCYETKYLDHVGKTGGSASIDRKDDQLGYHIWNIQLLTLADNSRKQFAPNFTNAHAASHELIPTAPNEPYDPF